VKYYDPPILHCRSSKVPANNGNKDEQGVDIVAVLLTTSNSFDDVLVLPIEFANK